MLQCCTQNNAPFHFLTLNTSHLILYIMKNTLLGLSLLALPAAAQTDWFNAQLEFRSEYVNESVDSHTTDAGFRGQYLNLKLNGKISDKFSYAYRQRFSKEMMREGGFLKATDYLYLNYAPSTRWDIAAGKQIVLVGGYEYDYAPIDVYQYGSYCNQILPYGYGVSVGFRPSTRDKVIFQVAQSIFTLDGSHDRFGYNLIWYGSHGCFEPIYSLNMQEYAKGKYLNVIALGNKFNFPHGHALVDFTNRYASAGGAKFFGDFTAAAELHIQPVKALNVFTRVAYEKNDDNIGDSTVKPGTEQTHLGVGVEAFPLKGDPDIRLHAAYYHTWGQTTNPNETQLVDGDNLLTVGLTFRLNYQKIKERYKNIRNTTR